MREKPSLYRLMRDKNIWSKNKLRLQALGNIKKYGWKWKNPPQDEGLRKAWRYIWNIPDHIADVQLIRYIMAKEGGPKWSTTPIPKHSSTSKR